MKKSIRVGSVAIPLDDYVIGGSALLGIRDSGKTYAAKGIAEQLLEYQIPIIVFDPIGRWRFMKLAGDDAAKPKGFKIVVAGGEDPDLPLTPQSAPEIVRAAIRENIPLVLDFYDRKLSKADWRRIVQSCFRTLLYENKGLRHIFLEETAEFAPQKIQDGETYAEVEKLVRMGGNVSLGVTLINQRSQEINKAILDLCENLVLMRQRGAHAIDAVQKWMDKLAPDEAAKIAKSLPHMGPGDAWVFTGSSESAVRTRTAPIRSFHPNRRKPHLSEKATAARRTDTADFVSRMTGELETVIEESKTNDPMELRKRIVTLERQLKTGRPATVAAVDTKAIEARAYSLGRQAGIVEIGKGFQTAHQEVDKAVDDVFAAWAAKIATIKSITLMPRKPPTVAHPSPTRKPTGEPVRQPLAANGSQKRLPPGEAAVLTACIMYADGVVRERLTVLSGYKRSSRDEYVRRLVLRGFAEIRGDIVLATQAGIDALPDVQPLPTGEDLQQFWRDKLPDGERKLLDILIRSGGDSISRDALDEAGYKRSSRDEYLRRLQARALVIEPERGQVAASPNLF